MDACKVKMIIRLLTWLGLYADTSRTMEVVVSDDRQTLRIRPVVYCGRSMSGWIGE